MTVPWGYHSYTYYGAAGAPASTRAQNTTNISITATRDEDDATTDYIGETTGVAQVAMGLKVIEVSFEMLYDTSDAFFVSIRNAYINSTMLALRFLAVDGGEGWGGDWEIAKFDVPRETRKLQKVSVSVKPGQSTVNPVEWET